MGDPQEPQAEPVTLEEAARATADLAKRDEASRVAASFLEVVQRWAAPSAVLAAVRDPSGVAGFRLLPALSSGSIALGIEKTLARLVEDTPECLARPTLVRGEEMPGIRVRDNVVVPWWCEGDSGLLVLRGVPRPVRPGLGEALSLCAAAVWPRLLGGPAARVEALVQELQAAAARLDGEAARQLDRLKAAALVAAPPETPATANAEAARIAQLEETVADLEEALAKQKQELASGSELDVVKRELQSARHDLGTAQADAQAAKDAFAAAQAELQATRQELATAQSSLQSARQELEAGRRDVETARHERESAGLDLAAAKQQAENAKRELAAAVEERRSAERDLDVARRELAARVAAPQPIPETPTTEMPAVSLAAVGGRAGEALKLAIAAVRRAAFVPPMLRVSIEEVATHANPAPTPARKHGVALLDRDAVSLEAVAAELEQAGVEVRLANQPEELALLLRMPDAAGLDAVVCDVMSFRPDQNVAGLLRGWDKDRPGLAYFLSYDAQSPVELERARRTPNSLTAGHMQRPLTVARLSEALQNLAAKRQAKTP